MSRWFLPVLTVAALLTAGTVEHSGSAASAAHAARSKRAGTLAQASAIRTATVPRRTFRAPRSLSALTTIKLTLAFACIHSFEGAWTADTGNGYFGGLQMDWAFMRQYGAAHLRRYGTADKWPPAIQIQVAIRAERSGRGFGPWPQTARKCGLL